MGLLVGAPVGKALAVGSSPPALLDLLLILGALVDLELMLGALVDLLLTLGDFVDLLDFESTLGALVDFELMLGDLVDFELILGAFVLFGALVLLSLSSELLLAPFRVALKVLSIRCRRLGGFSMAALTSSESSGAFCLSMRLYSVDAVDSFAFGVTVFPTLENSSMPSIAIWTASTANNTLVVVFMAAGGRVDCE